MIRLLLFLIPITSLSTPAFAQRAIFVVRHAEKTTDKGADPALSPEGEARATALGRVLRDARVSAIFSTSFIRTMRTAEPLAKSLGVTVQKMDPTKTAAFVETLRKDHPNDRVLIVGHSNTVPDLLKAFGAIEKVKLSDADYDNLFVIIPTDKGPPTVLQLHY